MRAYSLSLSGEGLEFWGERSIFAVELEKGGKGFGCSGFPNDCF